MRGKLQAWRFSLIALVFGAWIGASADTLGPSYTVRNLGALPGTDVVIATSLNNQGQVVGYCYQHVPPGHLGGLFGHAFLWQKGKMRKLDTPGGEFSHAFGINERGDISGDALAGKASRPVVWRARARKPSALAEDAGSAVAINDRGDTIVHSIADVTGGDHDRWWLSAAGGREAVTPPDRRRIRLAKVNNLGTLIGHSYDTSGLLSGLGGLPEGERGFVVRAGKARWLSGLESGTCVPNDINHRDVVVGWVGAGRYGRRACRWDGDGMTDLGTLGGKSSEASAVNDRGDIVGYADGAHQRRLACLWSNGKTYDLQTRIPQASGVLLHRAVDVNDRGQILALGSTDSHRNAAFILTPRAQ
jgi:probable HAF family extracellular repeat protein